MNSKSEHKRMGIDLTLLLMDETNKNKLNLDEGAQMFI
jgi:hypothetical protein